MEKLIKHDKILNILKVKYREKINFDNTRNRVIIIALCSTLHIQCFLWNCHLCYCYFMYIYELKYENDIFFYFYTCHVKKNTWKKASDVEKVTHTAKKRCHLENSINIKKIWHTKKIIIFLKLSFTKTDIRYEKQQKYWCNADAYE